MLVCPDPKFAYFMPGRTATYSIFKALLAAFPKAEDVGHHHYCIKLDDHEDYCFVVSVRDPFSRAVSRWKLLGFRVASPWWGARRYHLRDICRDGGFRAFLLDPQLRQYSREGALVYAPIRKQMDEAGVGEANHVIRFETLQRDVNRLPFLKKGQRIKLPHLHKTEYEKPWHEHYTPELEDVVREIYADDFTTWDYSDRLEDYVEAG